ncbi:transmembrane protein 39A-A [Rhagoletis pomonella]|uniref:transmembrane protein 39A-A n=1 Tax=Rhagoletis pomonella TaxID=28610 RepID=UPI001785D7BD|nr:transmembrane protein 39A-A [Rhagoletis pomonella]
MGTENPHEARTGSGCGTSRRNSSCGGYSNIDATPMPKHIPFPEFSGSSELINELVMFLFTTFASAMQFINIYRTLWWMPESYIKHTVNVHLIEPYLVAFIVLLMSRRFIYCFLIRGQDLLHSFNSKYRRLYRVFIKYSFISWFAILLGFCVFKIYIKHSFIPVFLLIYPLVIYVLVFGFQIESFLRSSCEVEGAYFNGMPMHCCSSSPDTIRDEIDVLRNDFNIRFKQIFFTSMLNAYYVGLVPCFFTVSIYYNVIWAYQNAFYFWISCLTMAAAFGFPSKYSDILHRASLHLGYWSRMDVRGIGSCSGGGGASTATAASWKLNSVWVQGSVVKHNGELFSCLSPVTVALPGNSSHSRFYKLFRNPSIIYMVLTGLQAANVLAGIIVLYYAVEWHFVLSLSFVTLTNQFTFFKIMRDYLVTKRIYTAEAAIAEQTKANAQHSN